MPVFDEKAGFSGDYEDFKRLIKFYGNRLDYDDGNADMTLFFCEVWEKIHNGKYGDFSESAKRKYIAVALRNEFYRLAKARLIYVKKWADLYEDTAIYCNDIGEKLSILQAVQNLTNRQKTIVNLRYYAGFSDEDIAKSLNISRQAVCKARKRVLDKLKTLL